MAGLGIQICIWAHLAGPGMNPWLQLLPELQGMGYPSNLVWWRPPMKPAKRNFIIASVWAREITPRIWAWHQLLTAPLSSLSSSARGKHPYQFSPVSITLPGILQHLAHKYRSFQCTCCLSDTWSHGQLPLPLLTFISTSNQPCATNNRIKCCPWVPSVLSKIKLSSPVVSCIASSQAQKLFFMHIYILEYCFPKLLNESPDSQMVLFLPVQLPEFCYIYCQHLLHQPNTSLGMSVPSLTYPHILLSLLFSCFCATVFAEARKLGLLEVCSVQPQLGHGYLLGNCLFIPHWISGSCFSVAGPTFSLLPLIFPSLLLTDDNFLCFFSEVWAHHLHP